MKINFYRGFVADQRLSMEIYASQLATCFEHTNWQVQQVCAASSLEKYSANRWLMRYLRYWHFPRSVRQQVANVHHVVDHGYAHLWSRLRAHKHDAEAGKTSISVHDLIPLLASLDLLGSKTPHRRPWLNEYSLSFIEKYDQVIVPSENTAQDLQQHLSIKRDRIKVIPPVIAEHFKPMPQAAKARFAQRYQLDTHCQWLLITGQEFYKNHAASLAVLSAIRSSGRDLKLIKTGVTTQSFNEQVSEYGLEHAVENIYLYDPAELVDVYNFVDCLLFPSLYEGFGMPVAEALACATPVVASTCGSLSEIGDGLVSHAAPHDIDALVQQVIEVLDSEQPNPDFINKSQQAVAAYRLEPVSSQWQTAMAELLQT